MHPHEQTYFASVLSGLALLILTSNTLQSQVKLTAVGVVNGTSVLNCSVTHTNETIEYIFWYLFQSKYSPQIIYYDARSINKTNWSPGKHGPFKDRNVTGQFARQYHELVIRDTKLSDNKTTYYCAVKISRKVHEESSEKTHLWLQVLSVNEPVILDENNVPVASSNCRDRIPIHQVSAERVIYTCHAGGSMPAPKVDWLNHTNVEIKDPETRPSRNEKFGIEVKEVTRQIEVTVTGNIGSLECVVEEPDRQTGRQRKVHKCLRVVKSKPKLNPALQQLLGAVLFIVIPMTLLIVQFLWICCIYNKKGKCNICCTKLNSKLDQEPKIWRFVLMYMIGHIMMGLVAFAVCTSTYNIKFLKIVVVVVILIRVIIKCIYFGIWRRKKKQRSRQMATKQGFRSFLGIIIGWEETYDRKAASADQETQEGLVRDNKHQRFLVKLKCCRVFTTDVSMSVTYCIGILVNIIFGECNLHFPSVSVLLIVIYIGCISCLGVTCTYYCRWGSNREKLTGMPDILPDQTDTRQKHSQLPPLQLKEIYGRGIDSWKEICAKHYLRFRGKVRLIPWDIKAVEINDVYTTLAWVENKIRPDTTEKNHLHNYLQIFTGKNGIRPKRIVARGRAGTGKSTFVNKVAVDWAQLVCLESPYHDACRNHDFAYVSKLKALLREFHLVLPVNLRQVTADMTFIDAVFSQIPELPEDEKQQMLKYITKNQNKVLIIMDGYDEYTGNKKSEITDILDTNMFPECCVVTTTRPWKVAEMKRTEYIDVHVEVVGFSKENLENYILKFFHDPRNIKKGESKAKGLMDAICDSQNLLRLATIPLVALFLCLLWQNNQKLPSSMTCLYTKIVTFIVRSRQRTMHKGDNFEEDDENSNAIDLASYKDCLLELGKLALKGLKHEHNQSGLIFDCKEVKRTLKEETWELGFLSRLDVSSSLDAEARQVTFLHKSVQEYLAAYYVSEVLDGSPLKMNEEPILEYFDSMEKLYDFKLVIQFICGLSAGAANKILTRAVNIAEKDPNIMRDHEKPGPVWIGTFQPHYFKHCHRFTEFIFSCIFETDNQENVRIKLCHVVSKVNAERLDMLQKVLEDSQTDENSTIKMLCLCDLKELDENKNRGDDSVFQTFVMDHNTVGKYIKPIATAELTTFCLSFVNCLPGIVELSETVTKMTNITSLCMSEANLTQDSLKHLFNALSHTRYLKYINLSGNLLEDAVKDFATVLPKLKNLRALVLIRAGLNPERIQQLCGSLKGLEMMEIFDLSRNQVKNGINAICELFKVWPQLWRLKMQDCAIRKGDLKCLAKRLPQAIQLRELYLSWNEFGSEATSLVACFQKLVNLEKVHLLGTSLSGEDERYLQNEAAKTKGLKLFISAPPVSKSQEKEKEKRWSLAYSTISDYETRPYHSMSELSSNC